MSRIDEIRAAMAEGKAAVWSRGVGWYVNAVEDLLDEVERLEAVAGVRGAMWCRETREAGGTGCGACPICVAEARARGRADAERDIAAWLRDPEDMAWGPDIADAIDRGGYPKGGGE